MKFKIDENLPVEFAEVLRSFGYDAVTVLEQGIGGALDADLFSICRLEERILMSLDLDFTDIRFYPPDNSPGVVVFRVQPQDKLRLLECLHKTISVMKQEPVAGRLWIVEDDRIRVRE